MAPLSHLVANIAKRWSYCDDGSGDICYSTWDSWGRWAALAIIIVGFLLLVLVLSANRNRRRRRNGMAPMYGTGWIGTKRPGQSQAPHNYYGNQNQAYGAAPPYTPAPPGYMQNQQTGTTWNSNEGYYGNGNGAGIELQQPQSSYQYQHVGGANGGASEQVYEAPLGPPPGKGDYVIR